MTDHDLRSLRRRVHAVLASALVVSVAANVTAAEPTLIGRSVAAWPPLALMLTVDVLGCVPAGHKTLTNRLRLVAAFAVASVAAVASFSHMRHVALAAGESELVAWLFPLTVDGLAVVCSVALVQLANRTEPPANNTEAVTDPLDQLADLLNDSALPEPVEVESLAPGRPTEPVPEPELEVVSGLTVGSLLPVLLSPGES